ncbi:MAG: carbamoyltransferase N-terminal domain-containing protein [Candidatus Wallbacteria bacterium]|nr:carbamoyltransferase N-terminal domain-containing protein [Candidatus Wallbacteria bacterium]
MSRVKYFFDSGDAHKSLHYLLSKSGISPAEIAGMAVNYGAYLPSVARRDGDGFLLDYKLGSRQIPTRLFNHHLSHAAAVYHTSGLADCLIMVSDARGSAELGGYPVTEADWLHGSRGQEETISFYHGKKGVSLLNRMVFPHSLGEFYSLITAWLGFNSHNHPHDVEFNEGKTMGLAPYGAGFYKGETFIFLEKEGFSFNPEYIRVKDDSLFLTDLFLYTFGSYRQQNEPLNSQHQLAAFIAQNDLEKTVHYLIESQAFKNPAENLLLSGGTFHNSVLNGKLKSSTFFKNVFAMPAADDSGLAIGNAFLSYLSR